MSDFVRGFCRYPILVIAGVCAIAVAAQAQAGPQKTFQIAPSFEQDGGETSERYLWRNSGTAVSLGAGGRLSVMEGAGIDTHIGFAGASVQSEPRGEAPSRSQTIYYVGRGKTRRIAHFERVRYSAIYPGIDLVFVTTGRRLEYNFEIAAYADPRAIRIRSEESFRLTPGGDLEIRVGQAVITEQRPVAFQSVGGRIRPVACGYRLIGSHQAELWLGAYDPGEPLIIDPVFNFSTYLGGPSYDSINAAATDAQGNLYVAGETSSGSLTDPTPPTRSSRDAFVAKFNSTGTQVFAVYLGGTAYDSARGIALDSLGNIYVTGVTDSPDFPVTSGAFLTQAPGGGDAFVVKLNPSFNLQYATYLGGGSPDFGLAIAVDSTGAAYVTGQTESTAFPVTQGAFQTSNQGGVSDCFVSKLNPAGSALVYSTYLGGSGLDICAGIALDASGNAYAAGSTSSANFPVAGPLQSNLTGSNNAFVGKLNATGSALVYSTYLGGSNIDSALAIAVDASGEAYVTGDTSSIDFPTTPGVVQNTLQGLYNAFVSKLSATGNSLVYSTLLGGSGSDIGTAIAIDSAGRAVIGGYTTSSNFPTFQPIQTTFQGVFDAFSTVLDPTGVSLIFSSYFGGSDDDRGYGVALAPVDKLVLAGITRSTNFPVEAATQPQLSVAPDGFVMEVAYIATGGIPAANSVTPSSGSGTTQTFALQYSDTGGAGNLQQVGVYFNAALANPAINSCQLYFNISTNRINLLNDAGTAWLAATLGADTTLANSQCSLYVPGTTAGLNGNTLTLNVKMTFLANFAGAKNIYLSANDVSEVSTGWEQLGTWSVPGPAGRPSATSVTPSSGSGLSQTFSLQYLDTAGAASLQQVWVYFNATLATPASNSCQLYYNLASNQINLMNDAGTVWQAAILGSATTLLNSQCSLNVAATTITVSGNTLTLNVPLMFQHSFGGAQNIYMYATDVAGSNSGWQQRGQWIVPGGVGTPVAVSVTPGSGSGTSQPFALQYSDTAGAASLEQVWAYFNSMLANPAVNACMLYYNAANNQINLLNDAATAWLPALVGAATTLENSQCSFNAAATSVALNGSTLTLNVVLTFKPSFAGVKNVYLHAVDVSGANSGWQQMGEWTVSTGSAAPAAVTVTPSSGSGISQTFAFQYSDTAGAGNLQQAWVYFNATLANPATNACMLYYDLASSRIKLLNDTATAWLPGIVGAPAPLQNSQCSLNMTTATVELTGNILLMNVAITFEPSFAGVKNVYMHAVDLAGTNSGWQQLGAWTVSGAAGVPQTVSVTPNTQTGATQSFVLQYADTNGAASLQQVWVYFNSTLANPATDSCMLYYTVATNQINLLNDTATAWLPAILGTATSLENNQCSVNVADTAAALNGDTLTLNLTVTFKPAYAGTKNIYLHAVDLAGTKTAWQQLGTTAAVTAGTPATVSVTPSAESGMSQTFALQFSDTNGAASLQQVWVYFNATLANPASQACMLYYNVATNQVDLLNDNATAWLPATVGGAATLQNSQCSLNMAITTVALSGNSFTLNIPITFQPAFAGTKNIYMYASDVSGASTSWQQLGFWTIP